MSQGDINNLLFEGLSAEEVSTICTKLVRTNHATGDVIFREGEVGDSLFLIENGAVSISKRGRGGRQETLQTLEPGDFFGEIAVVDKKPRSANATASVETSLWKIDRETLHDLFALHPQIAFNFGRHQAQRVRHADEFFIEELLRSERMSVLGSMVGFIVHDLKNPMNVLMMVADYLEANPSTDDSLKILAVESRRAIETMVEMTDELLDFSRGKLAVSTERIELAKLQQALEEQIINHLKQGGMEVETEFCYDQAVNLDLNRFTRVLVNIIRNAAEAMPAGRAGKIRLSATAVIGTEAELEFQVADNGSGIPEEIQPRLFEPFVTHGKQRGTGLGMAIAKSVVEAHGGSIRFESELGQGTTFFVRIPTEG